MSERRLDICQELPPSGGTVFYYPGAATTGGANADGLLLRVSASSGSSWIAMCRGGFRGAEGIFQLSRDPSRFIVVHAGCGYRIAYDAPSIWEVLPMGGFARYAIYSENADIVMLFDWTSGIGYGPEGTVWKTPRLFLDELEVVRCDAEQVALKGLDLPGEETSVVLNIRDGSVVSGKPTRLN